MYNLDYILLSKHSSCGFQWYTYILINFGNILLSLPMTHSITSHCFVIVMYHILFPLNIFVFKSILTLQYTVTCQKEYQNQQHCTTWLLHASTAREPRTLAFNTESIVVGSATSEEPEYTYPAVVMLSKCHVITRCPGMGDALMLKNAIARWGSRKEMSRTLTSALLGRKKYTREKSIILCGRIYVWTSDFEWTLFNYFFWRTETSSERPHNFWAFVSCKFAP